MRRVILITLFFLNSLPIFTQQRVCAKENSGWHYYVYNVHPKEFEEFKRTVLEQFRIAKNLKKIEPKNLHFCKMTEIIKEDAKELLVDNTVAIIYFNIEDATAYDCFIVHRIKHKYFIEWMVIE